MEKDMIDSIFHKNWVKREAKMEMQRTMDEAMDRKRELMAQHTLKSIGDDDPPQEAPGFMEPGRFRSSGDGNLLMMPGEADPNDSIFNSS